MGVKEKYNPDETRNELLLAASKEIYEYGFQAASLKRILTNVNHTKGALYHHFSSKKKLGLSVIEEIIARNIYTVFIEPLEKTDNPISVLCEIFQKKADTLSLDEIKHGCPLNNLIQEMSFIDKDFNKILVEISDNWISSIANAMDRGKAKGNIRNDVDGKGVALLVVASVEGAFGLSKMAQTNEIFVKCMSQLEDYVKGLN
jgi:AcrR family transcriptional regulator